MRGVHVRVWRSMREVPSDLERTSVTVGNFDGVHLGHRHVIRRTRQVAEENDLGQVVAVTFDPHPIAVLRPEHAPPTITTIERRVDLLEDAGVDAVLVVPFSREIAEWSPERFIQDILVDTLHAGAVVVGANFRFGYRAAGDITTLQEAGERLGFLVDGIALDGGPQVWSSTYVRNCLAAGDVEGAAEALGQPFAVRGHVVPGDKRGHELGFPTANVPTREMHIAPADGVYAGWVRRLHDPVESRMPAAISVGTNPTFTGQRERRVESYVLDRDDLELYGEEVEVCFAARIRGMERFDSVDQLVAAMHRDVDTARRLLAS